jgi:hypothetical protein
MVAIYVTDSKCLTPATLNPGKGLPILNSSDTGSGMISYDTRDGKGRERDSGSLSPEREAEIRGRIETRYYDRPEVVAAIARAVLADRGRPT